MLASTSWLPFLLDPVRGGSFVAFGLLLGVASILHNRAKTRSRARLVLLLVFSTTPLLVAMIWSASGRVEFMAIAVLAWLSMLAEIIAPFMRKAPPDTIAEDPELRWNLQNKRKSTR
jgi:hypothetical protein